MSKLTDILDTLVINAHNHSIRGDSADFKLRDIDEAEAAINAYIAEVIGSNDKYPKLPNNSGMYSPELVTKNKLRAEQRKRAEL